MYMVHLHANIISEKNYISVIYSEMILRDMSTNNFLIQRKNTNMVHIAGFQSLFYPMNVYVKK